MLWVVLNHVTEQLAGGNIAADPTGSWPPLHERIAQWQSSVTGFGAFSWPLTAARDVGWLADQAVSIFIILSGFGLALGLIASHAGPTLDAPDFLKRRLRRIYPLWWGRAHLVLTDGLPARVGPLHGRLALLRELRRLALHTGCFRLLCRLVVVRRRHHPALPRVSGPVVDHAHARPAGADRSDRGPRLRIARPRPCVLAGRSRRDVAARHLRRHALAGIRVRHGVRTLVGAGPAARRIVFCAARPFASARPWHTRPASRYRSRCPE